MENSIRVAAVSFSQDEKSEGNGVERRWCLEALAKTRGAPMKSFDP